MKVKKAQGRPERQKLNKRKTNQGAMEFFSEGGSMDKKAYQAKEKRHVAAMKKAGVPKRIVKEEQREAGLKCGGSVKKMAKGGGIESRGKTKGKMV